MDDTKVSVSTLPLRTESRTAAASRPRMMTKGSGLQTTRRRSRNQTWRRRWIAVKLLQRVTSEHQALNSTDHRRIPDFGVASLRAGSSLISNHTPKQVYPSPAVTSPGVESPRRHWLNCTGVKAAQVTGALGHLTGSERSNVSFYVSFFSHDIRKTNISLFDFVDGFGLLPGCRSR